MSWRHRLSAREQQLLEESEAAILLPPPERKGLARWTEQRLEQLGDKVPEVIRQQLTQAISSALETMQRGSNWLVSRDSVHERLRWRLGDFPGPAALLQVPCWVLDEVAQDYARRATTGLTIEGAAAGAAGLVGLAADIPILYCTLFKTIQEIALCYGFPVKPPQERYHLFQALDLGHSLHHRERGRIAEQGFLMQELIRQGTRVEVLEAVAAQSYRGSGTSTQALARNLRLARQLALDLLERKLLQGLVIVGSAIGAAANYTLARDVGNAAFHLYRRRFLMEVALRR